MLSEGSGGGGGRRQILGGAFGRSLELGRSELVIGRGFGGGSQGFRFESWRTGLRSCRPLRGLSDSRELFAERRADDGWDAALGSDLSRVVGGGQEEFELGGCGGGARIGARSEHFAHLGEGVLQELATGNRHRAIAINLGDDMEDGQPAGLRVRERQALVFGPLRKCGFRRGLFAARFLSSGSARKHANLLAQGLAGREPRMLAVGIQQSGKKVGGGESDVSQTGVSGGGVESERVLEFVRDLAEFAIAAGGGVTFEGVHACDGYCARSRCCAGVFSSCSASSFRD